MTPVDEYRAWIEKTKPLVGGKAKKSFSEKNDNVAKLLKQFESAQIPGQGDYLVEYERLAARATETAEAIKKGESVKDKSAVKLGEKELTAIAKELEGLERRMAAEKANHDKWLVGRAQLFKTAGDTINAEIGKIRKTAQDKLKGQNSIPLDFLTNPLQDQYQALDFDVKKLAPGDPLDPAKKAFETRMKNLVAEKEAIIKSSDFLQKAKTAAADQQKAKDNAEQEALARELRSLRADARKLLPSLEDVGVPAADIQAFDKHIEDATSGDELKRIEAQIEMRRKGQVATQATKAKSIKQEIEAVNKLLEEKKTEFKKNPPALKTLEVVGKDLASLDSLIGASHPGALEGAQITCTRIKRVLNATSADGGFGAILGRISKQEEVLKDASVKKYHEDNVNQLTLRINKLREEGIDPFDLAPASKEIEEIEFDAKNLVAAEKELQSWRAGIEQWLETTKNATRTVDEFINRPGLFEKIGAKLKGKSSMIDVLSKDIAGAYNEPAADTAAINAKRAQAQGRIDDLLKLLKMQTDQKAAEQQVAKVQAQLDTEYSDGAAELKTRKEKEDAEAKDRENWTKEKKAFKVAFDEKKKAVREAKGPKADLQAIEGIFESAKKAGENNLQAGRDQLALAKRRLEQLDPKGVSFDTPDQLPETPKRWANALGNFSANLDELAKRAETSARSVPLPAPAIAEITGKIGRARALFDAKAFAGAPKLIDTSLPLSERKKIREEVLREVRRQKALLLSDPTLALIRRNPFKVTGVARDVRACLDSLELNALRAVPAK
jgi:hypothetical protein